jgi:tetratricopeptide (TPR) repeat protein
LGRYEEALSAYENAIKLDNKDCTLWASKADTLHALGRYEEEDIANETALKIANGLDDDGEPIEDVDVEELIRRIKKHREDINDYLNRQKSKKENNNGSL